MGKKKKRFLMIDADNTLYELSTKEQAYSRLFEFVAKELNKEIKEVKEEFWKIVQKKKSSKIIHERKREVPLKEMGLEGKKIKKALELFHREILNGIKVREGVKDLLKECEKRGIEIVVFSEEFKDFLKEKLKKALGNEKVESLWLITPEDVQSFKPNKKYYEMVLEKGEILLVVGDDYEKDLKIAEETFSLEIFHLKNEKDIKEIVKRIKENKKELNR